MSQIIQSVVLIIAIFALGVSAAKAEQNSIALGGFSVHVADIGHTNSIHNNVIVTYKGITAGYFKNSYDKDSFVVAYRWEKNYDRYRVGGYVGVVKGYDKCLGKFSEEEVRRGEKPVGACGMGALSVSYITGSQWEPQLTIFGEALVASARYNF